jgi:hypothetical protein
MYIHTYSGCARSSQCYVLEVTWVHGRSTKSFLNHATTSPSTTQLSGGISSHGRQIRTVEMTEAAEAKICPGSSSRKSAARRDLDLPESSLRTPQLTCAYPPPVHVLHTVQRNLGIIEPHSPHVCCYRTLRLPHRLSRDVPSVGLGSQDWLLSGALHLHFA